MTEGRKRAERMAELPEETREFLAELKPEDLSLLRHGLKLIKAVMTVSRATRWLLVTVIGILAGIVLLGESLSKLWGWFHRS